MAVEVNTCMLEDGAVTGCFDCTQWVVRGAVDVDIGANASAEDGEDESVDDQAVKVVDIIDTFRLQVTCYHLSSRSLSAFPNGRRQHRRQPLAHSQSDERRSHTKQAGHNNAVIAQLQRLHYCSQCSYEGGVNKLNFDGYSKNAVREVRIGGGGVTWKGKSQSTT